MQDDRSTTARATGRDLIAWGVLLAGLLVLWSIAGYDLYAGRDQLMRLERARLAHQVRLAEENLAGQLRLTSRALDGIRKDLAWFKANPQASGNQLFNSRLASMASAMQGVRSVLIIDVDGNCVASNRPELVGQNFRNGERYRTISQGNDPNMLYLSAPFLTPLKTWAMSAGRVVQDSQGRFNGYVLAVLDPEYFSLLMRSVLFAQDMRAAVIHWDGLVVLREPDPERLIGQDLSQNPRSLFAQYKAASAPAAGLFEGVSGATGTELMAMLRVVKPQDVPVDKPLVFGVSRDRDAILGTWEAELRVRLAGLAALSLAAVLVLVLFQRRQVAFRLAQVRQAEALAERQEQLDTFIEHAPASLALLDRQMRYLLASRQWLADFGLDGQAVAGHDCFALSPDLPGRWRTVFERAFAGEVVQLEEDFRQRGDGSPQWLRWEVRPCRVTAGEVQTIAVFAEDVTAQRREAQRLRESEQRWRFAIDSSELGLWDWDVKAGTVFFSRRWKSMLGFGPDEVGSDLSEWSKRVHPDDMPQVMADVQRLLRGESEHYSNEHRVLCKDGSWKWILDRGTVVRRDDDGQPLRAIGTHTDLTELKAREARLALNAGVFNHTSEAIVICGPDNEIESVNEAFTRITGYGVEEVKGRNPRLLASGRHDRNYYREMWDHIGREGYWQGEIWNRRRNGELFVAWLTINVDRAEDGRVRHYYTVFSDLTQRRQTEERLLQLTHYDALTDLPNRTLLQDRLALAVAQAHRDGQAFAVMVLDLDRFKNVNDSLGHGVGDQLLVEVGRRLQRTVRHQDTVARLGGDEFAVVLAHVDADGAAHAAQAIRLALGLPVAIDDHDLVVTPSIGIAVFPADGEDAQALLQAADTAMFRAKAEGGHTFRFHTVEMHQKVSRLLELENGLRAAVEEGQLLLHYQPQLAVDGLAVVACEALVRWQHPRLGLVSPGEFIPIAEESGQIVHLGAWVMRTAAAQAKAWQDAGLPPFVMAVNVSKVQFGQDDFVEQVGQVLASTGLAPHWLEIELTESVVAHDPERVVRTIERLHALGVQLSIDDFGTGYSSLGYLRRFRIHKLKIDQSFVQEVVEDANSASIVRAIISMARDLGLETLAEGVETEAQFQWLERAGCEQVQGFRFARPMPEPALAQWLQERVTPNGQEA